MTTTPSLELLERAADQTGTVIAGLRITSKTGDCVQIINSINVTIKNSEIGPCGTDNSTTNSRGIYINGGSGTKIYDNYIHVENLASGCCDTSRPPAFRS